MKITYNRSEIMKLAHARMKLGVHFSTALKIAWFRAKQLMKEALQGEVNPQFEGRYLVSFPGMVQEAMIPMPDDLRDWVNKYGAE